jgi:hypothetical protein
MSLAFRQRLRTGGNNCFFDSTSHLLGVRSGGRAYLCPILGRYERLRTSAGKLDVSPVNNYLQHAAFGV